MSFGKRPAEELYKIPEDSDCVENLADDPAHAETKKRMRAELERRLKDDGDPRALGRGWVFDTYKYTGGRRHAFDAWLANHAP